MAGYTQDQINAAYATERANGASDADLQRIGAEKYGVTADQFNLASQAWGGGSAAPAPAPAAAPADRFTQAQYDTARSWATGKTFDQIGAEAQRLGLTAAEVGKIFGEHGGSAQQVMDASKYGTEGWDGFQEEASKWSFSGTGWDRAADKPVDKGPPKTGINLSQMQGATRWEVAPNETVRSQLEQIIADDSPLMQQARARALQTANSRGLLNSSMAMTAADSAMYDAAMPIATQDAATYARAGEFNANTANTFARDNNQFVRDAYMADFNVGANEWAAQRQFDREYQMLDRQQQLTLERDAIQNGYQSARDKFAAEQQLSRDKFAAEQQTIRDDKDIAARMALGQLDAASRAASIQPDTSMARLQMQMLQEDKNNQANRDQNDFNNLSKLYTAGSDQIASIIAGSNTQEVKDAAIASIANSYNPQLRYYADKLNLNPASWQIDLGSTKTPAPAPAPSGPSTSDTIGAGTA